MRARFILSVFMCGFLSTSASAQEESVVCHADQVDGQTGAFPCDFVVPMAEATSNEVIQANFTLPALGTYYETEMSFYRNGARVYDVSTYAVTWAREGDHVRLKISSIDKKNRHGKFDHHVEGKLWLKPDGMAAN